MLWVVDGGAHFLASVASSFFWLLLTSILWVRTITIIPIFIRLHPFALQGVGAGLMYRARGGGDCVDRPSLSRSVSALYQ